MLLICRDQHHRHHHTEDAEGGWVLVLALVLALVRVQGMVGSLDSGQDRCVVHGGRRPSLYSATRYHRTDRTEKLA